MKIYFNVLELSNHLDLEEEPLRENITLWWEKANQLTQETKLDILF